MLRHVQHRSWERRCLLLAGSQCQQFLFEYHRRQHQPPRSRCHDRFTRPQVGSIFLLFLFLYLIFERKLTLNYAQVLGLYEAFDRYCRRISSDHHHCLRRIHWLHVMESIPGKSMGLATVPRIVFIISQLECLCESTCSGRTNLCPWSYFGGSDIRRRRACNNDSVWKLHLVSRCRQTKQTSVTVSLVLLHRSMLALLT